MKLLFGEYNNPKLNTKIKEALLPTIPTNGSGVDFIGIETYMKYTSGHIEEVKDFDPDDTFAELTRHYRGIPKDYLDTMFVGSIASMQSLKEGVTYTASTVDDTCHVMDTDTKLTTKLWDINPQDYI